MAKLGMVNMVGRSGSKYRFRAYPLATLFKKGIAAVCVMTRRRECEPDGGFKHRRIGIDQTDDLRRLVSDHREVLSARGVNCVCVRGEVNHRARLDIQQDLRRR